MQKIEIHLKLYESLGLSDNEKLVFDVLLSYRMANSIPKIRRVTGLPRSTVRDILLRLEARNLAVSVLSGKRYSWRFKSGIEKIGRYGVKYVPKVGGGVGN